MLLGLSGTFIAAFLFGISKTFSMAVMARFFHGFMNGNIGITKTYLAEITDSTNKAQGFSVLGIASGIGRVVGPILGGFLVFPAKNIGFLKDTFLDTYPYLLPCLASMVLTLFGFIAGLFFLEESLPKKKKKKY